MAFRKGGKKKGARRRFPSLCRNEEKKEKREKKDPKGLSSSRPKEGGNRKFFLLDPIVGVGQRRKHQKEGNRQRGAKTVFGGDGGIEKERIPLKKLHTASGGREEARWFSGRKESRTEKKVPKVAPTSC